MPYWIWWLAIGVVLSIAEVVFPTAYIEFAMGLSALIVAVVAWFFPGLHLFSQGLLWLILSFGLVWFSRRLVPKHPARMLQDATTGQTMTAIPPGGTGRILYEGNSWQGRCEDETLEISANEKVYVVRREGTTLIVLPERSLTS